MGIKKKNLEVNVSIEEIKNVLYLSFCKLIFSNWICLICKMRNIANVLKILKPNKSPGEAEVISGIYITHWEQIKDEFFLFYMATWLLFCVQIKIPNVQNQKTKKESRL